MSTTHTRAKTSTLVLLIALYALSVIVLIAGVVFIFVGYASQSALSQSSSTATDTAALYAAYSVAQSITALGSPLVVGGFVGIALAIVATIYRAITFPKAEVPTLRYEFDEAELSDEAVDEENLDVAAEPATLPAEPEVADVAAESTDTASTEKK